MLSRWQFEQVIIFNQQLSKLIAGLQISPLQMKHSFKVFICALFIVRKKIKFAFEELG